MTLLALPRANGRKGEIPLRHAIFLTCRTGERLNSFAQHRRALVVSRACSPGSFFNFTGIIDFLHTVYSTNE
jgi:hypothetical protein